MSDTSCSAKMKKYRLVNRRCFTRKSFLMVSKMSGANQPSEGSLKLEISDLEIRKNLSLVVRKPVFKVSDQVLHKMGCTVTEDGWKLEISDLGSRGSMAKTKALISFSICVFVFAYGRSRFSHDVAHRVSRQQKQRL